MKNESQLTTWDISVLYIEWTKGTTANIQGLTATTFFTEQRLNPLL